MLCPRMTGQEESSTLKEGSFSHKIEMGDHLIRWTNMALWPVQVHAICLESDKESITLVDFGLTSSKKRQEKDEEEIGDDEEKKEPNFNGSNEYHHDPLMEAVKKYQHEIVGPKRIKIVTIRTEKELKKWHKVEYGKKVGNGFWKLFQRGSQKDENDEKGKVGSEPSITGKKAERKKMHHGNDDLTLFQKSKTKSTQASLLITPTNEPHKWKSANSCDGIYSMRQTSLLDCDETLVKNEIDVKENIKPCPTQSLGEISTEPIGKKAIQSGISEEAKCSLVENRQTTVKYNTIPESQAEWKVSTEDSSSTISRKVVTDKTVIHTRSLLDEEASLSHDEPEISENGETIPPSLQEERSIPKSDPANMVLSRVRYLLNNPGVLPPHNIFHANSECIAVWCKTGRWSTIQASIFLHTTAAGNLKSAISVSAVAASATATTTSTALVTTTTPMWGPLGWMGLTTSTTQAVTTTSTVGFLSLHPWLIPVLAGYGAIAVGAPMVLLAQAKKRWERTTQRLTDDFWEWADHDVYVEAIQSWSKIL